jgi:hypothetical protein
MGDGLTPRGGTETDLKQQRIDLARESTRVHESAVVDAGISG